jgi:hypothetical protein
MPEHAVHPDRHPEVLAEFLGQGQIGDLETALAGRTVIGTLSTEVAPICMSSGTSSLSAPRTPASSAWASSTDRTAVCTWAGADSAGGSTARSFLASSWDGAPAGPTTNWRRSTSARSMSTITQLAMLPASTRAHRCSVTASLNVLLSSSTRVTAVTMSIRRVIAPTSPSASSAGGEAGRRARAGAGAGAGAGARAGPAAAVCGLAAATTTSRVPSGKVMTSTARVTSTGPSAPSIRQ